MRTAVQAPPLPTFLIIGAQKSATRWLRANLGIHPQIHTAKGEPNFFSRQREYAKGTADYRALFEGWRGQPHIGEATPAYLMWHRNPAKIAERIDETLPGVRLLAVLRNPIDRAYSALIHHVIKGRLPAGTDLVDYAAGVEAPRDKLGVVSGGWYAASLRPYRQRFGPRLLVLFHDDVKADAHAVYRQACAHVGADTRFVPPRLTEVREANPSPAGSPYTQADGSRRKLSRQERLALWPHFAEDVAELERLTGRDLSAWRP